MTDNTNKNIDNEELDLEQLEDVSGGGILDIIKEIAPKVWSSQGNNDKSDPPA